MGLCKCPKRKVTNLFCFEHRVNVCESCLVANHESCVVQTYLSWLTDSDYDPNCLLCSEPFPSKENVRLKCFHVFHWACLNGRFAQLPNTTAPAGYKCPSCLDVIFPANNQTSPVVDLLREKLQTVNWARNGLGLPTLPELDSNSVFTNNYKPRAEPIPVRNPPLESPVGNHRSNRGSFSVNMEDQNGAPHGDPFEVNTFTDRSKLLEIRSITLAILRLNS
uniref:Zinc finger protein-like 1 homolog n=1 Tax=Ditylenchus dipsaci TaxID=166011 RepID=A0A915D8S8_9BILA